MWNERIIQLLGQSTFDCLQQTRVILFGVGGVGGWCAEALVRSGIGHLTIVDYDVVSETNLNRQLVATAENIGRSKVDELRKRLLTIQPTADIVAIHQKYESEDFPVSLREFDYVVDAIDSLDCKVRLIYEATKAEVTLFSSMGAARKIDTEQIRVNEFWKVEGCPLARALRQRMKKTGLLPQQKFLCVWSPELSTEAGTIAPIVGVFGMKLANLVIRSCANNHSSV